MQVRVNVMFGLRHVEPEDRVAETTRLLVNLSQQIAALADLPVKTSIVLKDVNGNRVGVFDVFPE